MRKLFAVIFILLILPYVAFAENSFDVQGEWYVIASYGRHPVSVDDDGAYHVSYSDVEAIFYPDGTLVTTGDGESKCNVFSVSEDAILFYHIQDREIIGYLVLRIDGGLSCFDIYNSSLVLLADGVGIPYGKGNPMQYYIIEDQMYILDESGYNRGSVIRYGDEIFMYKYETVDEKIREYTPYSFIIFISSSIIE